MDLKGAEVRSFYNLTNEMGAGDKAVAESIRIPHYQRPYKWTPKFVGDLIGDWDRENQKSSDAEYFAGSIVTVINTDYERGVTHQLIDGQQRFTTIYLVNFVLFLLLRVTIRQGINSWKPEIFALMEKLEKSFKYSFSNGEFDISSIRSELSDAFSERDSTKVEEVLQSYFDVVKLPNAVEGNDRYEDEHKELLAKQLDKTTLQLTYDRISYNKSIKNALSRIVVTLSDQNEPQIKTNRDGLKEGDKDKDIEIVYLDAVDQIFSSFTTIGGELNERSANCQHHLKIDPFINKTTT